MKERVFFVDITVERVRIILIAGRQRIVAKSAVTAHVAKVKRFALESQLYVARQSAIVNIGAEQDPAWTFRELFGAILKIVFG